MENHPAVGRIGVVSMAEPIGTPAVHLDVSAEDAAGEDQDRALEVGPPVGRPFPEALDAQEVSAVAGSPMPSAHGLEETLQHLMFSHGPAPFGTESGRYWEGKRTGTPRSAWGR